MAAAGDGLDAEDWLEEFEVGVARIAGRFAWVEPRRRARAFLLGSLSDLDTRSCWQLAEQAGDASPHGMQRARGRRTRQRYGGPWALRDCTARLPAGRVAALVARTGAGKSTLLHLAVGLLRPDAGEVKVFGAAPYEDFTADELLRLGGKVNRRWDAAVPGPGWPSSAFRPASRSAGSPPGKRAQVALALALAKRPRLLLLDEPVASLDPLARPEFLQSLMGSVAESGTTVLLSSHILADLERSCDFLIVLQAGTVQLSGVVDDIVAGHWRLVDPRHLGEPIDGVGAVVRARHTDRPSTLLVRTDGPVRDPSWTVDELTLDDLILAYSPTATLRPTMKRGEYRHDLADLGSTAGKRCSPWWGWRWRRSSSRPGCRCGMRSPGWAWRTV